MCNIASDPSMHDYARTDVYSPEVEAIADMSTCVHEAHVPGCPCGVGGDAVCACGDTETIEIHDERQSITICGTCGSDLS